MFRDIDADVYIMIDGDDTYTVEEINTLIQAFEKFNADMVIGDRISNGSYRSENKRSWHGAGNRLVTWLINKLFHAHLKDIMSGFRVFSRKFVKNYPVLCKGFELETEMTVFALNNYLTIAEVPINFKERMTGSYSKLHTVTDGGKVLITIFNLFRHYRPLLFFGSVSALLVLLSILIGIPVIVEYFKYQYVYKLPSAVLASAVMLLAVLSYVIGLILDTISIIDRKNFQIHLNKP